VGFLDRGRSCSGADNAANRLNYLNGPGQSRDRIAVVLRDGGCGTYGSSTGHPSYESILVRSADLSNLRVVRSPAPVNSLARYLADWVGTDFFNYTFSLDGIGGCQNGKRDCF